VSYQQQPVADGGMPRQPINVDDKARQATHASLDPEGRNVPQPGTAFSRPLDQACRLSHGPRMTPKNATECGKRTEIRSRTLA
jgi:hypothetical protein